MDKPNRRYAHTKSFTLKFPIDRNSRAVVDAEVRRVSRSVIPLVAEEKGKPCVAGSAVAIRFRGASFLVTAEHVLERFNGAVGYFAFDGWTRPLAGEFHVSEFDDLAIKLLPDTDVDDLRHVNFLDEDDLAQPEDLDDRFYASIVGYPSSAAKRHDKISLATPLETMSHFGKIEPSGRVSIAFNKKEGGRGSEGHTIPRDPFGKSGGAIFSMRTLGRVILPGQSVKLAGIALEWRKQEKRIVGANVLILKKLMVGAIAGSK
jgi:hypothetical protein